MTWRRWFVLPFAIGCMAAGYLLKGDGWLCIGDTCYGSGITDPYAWAVFAVSASLAIWLSSPKPREVLP